MNIETITPDQIQKLIEGKRKAIEANLKWKEKNRDSMLNYHKNYNQKYFDAMKEQSVFCSCCQKELKKISYSKHCKSKKHCQHVNETVMEKV